MARLIDADALAEEIRSMHITIGGRDIFPQEAKACVLMHIETEPTVDAAQVVVRCGDCMWREIDECGNYRSPFVHDYRQTMVEPDDFCSYAERRDAEC